MQNPGSFVQVSVPKQPWVGLLGDGVPGSLPVLHILPAEAPSFPGCLDGLGRWRQYLPLEHRADVFTPTVKHQAPAQAPSSPGMSAAHMGTRLGLFKARGDEGLDETCWWPCCLQYQVRESSISDPGGSGFLPVPMRPRKADMQGGQNLSSLFPTPLILEAMHLKQGVIRPSKSGL